MPRALGWAEFLAAQGTRTAPTNQVHLPAASWHSSSRSQIKPFAVKLALTVKLTLTEKLALTVKLALIVKLALTVKLTVTEKLALTVKLALIVKLALTVKLAPGLQASACRLARPGNLARAWLSSALSFNCDGATARSQLAHLLKVQSSNCDRGLSFYSPLSFPLLSFCLSWGPEIFCPTEPCFILHCVSINLVSVDAIC